jgi:hypothetical protein
MLLTDEVQVRHMPTYIKVSERKVMQKKSIPKDADDQDVNSCDKEGRALGPIRGDARSKAASGQWVGIVIRV